MISNNPEEFVFLGEGHIFLFQHGDDKMYSIYLKEDGKILVTLEPNMEHFDYGAWGDFEKQFEVFAAVIKENIRNKIMTGIEKMSKECSQQAFKDISDRMYC